MFNNGLIYLWVPSALTLSYLTAETAAQVNAVHAMIGDPRTSYVAGELNPYYFQLNDLDMGGAPFTRDATPGKAVCGPIENLAYLSLDYVTLIVVFGGELEAFPVFFELDLLTGQVPESFPERTYIDAEGVEQVHTWETWGVSGASHAPVQYGLKWYRSAAYGAAGTMLNASQWISYRNVGGIVKTLGEYRAIQAANAPGA